MKRIKEAEPGVACLEDRLMSFQESADFVRRPNGAVDVEGQEIPKHSLFFRTALNAGNIVVFDNPAEILGAHLLHVHAAQHDRRDPVQANEAQRGEGILPDHRSLKPAADLMLIVSSVRLR